MRRLCAVSLLVVLVACSGGGHGAPTGPARLAFSAALGNTASIYVVDADGTGLKRLTHGAYDTEPAWSPDSKKIAFVRASGPGSTSRSIYVMSADGSGPTRIGSGWDPAWSPDGQHLVFTDTDGSGTNIFVMRPDGSERVKIGPPGHNDRPSWAPDGKRILFVRCHQKGVNRCDVALTVLKTLTSVKLTEAAPDVRPAWSPDGSHVLFWVDRQGGGDISSMIAKHFPLSLPLTLSNDKDERDSTWSPNSSEIAFVRNSDIWKMTAGGSQQTQLTHGGPSSEPVWVTSRSIAFLRSPEHGESDVLLVDSDGTGLKTVFKGNAGDLAASI